MLSAILQHSILVWTNLPNIQVACVLFGVQECIFVVLCFTEECGWDSDASHRFKLWPGMITSCQPHLLSTHLKTLLLTLICLATQKIFCNDVTVDRSTSQPFNFFFFNQVIHLELTTFHSYFCTTLCGSVTLTPITPYFCLDLKVKEALKSLSNGFHYFSLCLGLVWQQMPSSQQ